MKLLFDENLSPRLPALLDDLFPGSAHLDACGLGAAPDPAVWSFARANGFIIVSKDSDYHDRSTLLGFPPKVIWVRTGNCATTHIANLLRTHSATIHTFAQHPTDSFLILS